MMKKKNIQMILALLAAVLFSCQKDTDIFIPGGTSTGLDTNWVAAVTDLSPVSEMKKLLRKETVLDSTDAAAGGTFQTADGLTVMVLPSSLLLPGGAVATGRIHIEMTLVKQRGDMIRLDKPTTSNGRVLVSGGEIFIKIRKDNEELHLAPGKGIYIKYRDPSASTQMRLFYGDESNAERFNWVPADNGNGGLSVDTANSTLGYSLFSTQLRWINCDYFSDSSGQRVNVAASLAPDYTNANTSVYLVFKDLKSVVGMYGDINSKRFMSPKVPVGKSVVLVSITRKGPNSYYLGHESATTGQTSLNGVQTVPIKPQPMSLTDIKAYLATL